MHTCGTSHLCKTADRVLDFLACDQHHISQLVDENDYLSHWLQFVVHFRKLVVGLKVIRSHIRKCGVAAHHLVNCPVQRTCRFFRIDDYGDEQMRDALEHLEFDHFRIDEYELYLIRLCVVEYAHDY